MRTIASRKATNYIWHTDEVITHLRIHPFSYEHNYMLWFHASRQQPPTPGVPTADGPPVVCRVPTALL